MVMAMATPIRSRNRILMRITIGQGRNAKTKSITPLYATNKIRTGHTPTQPYLSTHTPREQIVICHRFLIPTGPWGKGRPRFM